MSVDFEWLLIDFLSRLFRWLSEPGCRGPRGSLGATQGSSENFSTAEGGEAAAHRPEEHPLGCPGKPGVHGIRRADNDGGGVVNVVNVVDVESSQKLWAELRV